MATVHTGAAAIEKQSFFTRLNASFDKYFEAISVFPTIFIILLVILVPTILVVYQGFYTKDIILRIMKFVGMGNYVRALSGVDVDFYRYLGHTMLYVVLATTVGLALCILIAVLLNSRIKFRGVFVACFLLPWMVPPVTAAIMWKWMLNDSYGVLNYLLVVTGFLDRMFPFFSHSLSAWIWLIWVDIWYNSPFFIIILFAGLQRIPDDIIDAATIDGAGRWHFFTHVTIPYIKPEIQICLILRTIFVLRNFDFVYVFTRGGPVDSTEVLATYIYKVSMHFLKQGYGSAMSVIMLVMCALFTVFYLLTVKAEVEA
ncbi:MAG: sugar ABC transporter permease [Desulfobacterales bacterium]|nr:MAG: sugar ABC transporter permease [Desulfobacterales bacterium]